MLELVFKYILKNNYQSYDIPFWFEAHCTRTGSVPDPSRIFLPGPTSNFFFDKPKGASPSCDYVLTRMVLLII